MPPVDGDKLVLLVIEAVPGQNAVGVRDGHLLKAAIIEVGLGTARDRSGTIQPVPAERKDLTRHGIVLSFVQRMKCTSMVARVDWII